DGKRRVVVRDGDLWLIRTSGLRVTRLTHTRDVESQPVFGRDGDTVYFVRDGNAYALGLSDGTLRQLTDIRHGKGPPEEERPVSEQRAWLEHEQKELFDIIRTRAEEAARDSAERKRREADDPEPVYIADGERVRSLDIEPGGRWAAVLVTGEPEKERHTTVARYVTKSGYVETIEGREKVGDFEAKSRLGIADLTTGKVTWLDLAPPADATRYDSAAVAGQPALADIGFGGWSDDGTLGLVGTVTFAYKDEYLYAVDGATGRLTLLTRDHDDAWIGGPCPAWSSRGCVGWIPGGHDAWFLSERSGWSHLYRIGADSVASPSGPARTGRPLTSGAWEVKSASISPDRKHFDLTTSEGSPYERHLWRTNLDGSGRTRITTRTGLHDATPSPDGRRLADVWSVANRPPELYLRDARPGAEPIRVTTSPTKAWRDFAWMKPEIIAFTARDDVRVPASLYRPRDVGAEPNGAAVVFVHGAGYLHNVTRGWSDYYYREYMFNQLLASRGYTVLAIDYRGSAGYGRDWRTAIYRHMGGKDLDDQVDGVKWLLANAGIDSPERVGIYGGSYGGFMTLMALFTTPQWFGAGAALRSVTDWAHYNHWYTSRILNLPQTDSAAYRRSSPIFFADGLRDPLLIAHGIRDTNVEFQDVARLAQKLIELGKTGWTLAPYPVETHGFVVPSSWTDEYRRILALFERTIGPEGSKVGE
ncbi:MAG TPA: prolyl oligopeptidase family serine peptidase, partial [Gemmatimonadota bacterium]|nr:prolyl oligopeptidase family serine peptidase [Gemmatimonadota bacterium]